MIYHTCSVVDQWDHMTLISATHWCIFFCFAQALEGEVSRLSQCLEASLIEKGEIASRLNSTQDEVRQMRTGIEKLQVRIESDERKKQKMGELLKGIVKITSESALLDRVCVHKQGI